MIIPGSERRLVKKYLVKKQSCENRDFAGDSEAVVTSNEADRDAGGDGRDQEHLEHHQYQRQGPPPAQTDRKGTQNTALTCTTT